MQFCILYCELEESASDSFSYFLVRYNNTGNLRKDLKKSWGTCKSLNEIIDSIDCPVFIFTQFSYKVINLKLIGFENLNYKLFILSSFLELPETWDLYEIFSFYFDSGDKVLSDNNMIDAIVSLLLDCIIDMQYTYCVYFRNYNEYTFSWFYIDNKSSLIEVGSDILVIEDDTSKNYILGKFIKSLRYKIAMSGCCISRVKFLTWNSDCITKDILRYLPNFSYLEDFFKSIKGLDLLDYYNIVKLLGCDFKFEYSF